MVWQIRCRIAACVALWPASAVGAGNLCTSVKRRSTRLWAIAAHSTSLRVSSVRAVASSIREKTSAKPPGATTRGSPKRGLPVMRPCSASEVTDSTIARMSR